MKISQTAKRTVDRLAKLDTENCSNLFALVDFWKLHEQKNVQKWGEEYVLANMRHSKQIGRISGKQPRYMNTYTSLYSGKKTGG